MTSIEDVPDLGRHRIDVLLGGLDVLDGLPLDEPAHDDAWKARSAITSAARTGGASGRSGDDHRAAE